MLESSRASRTFERVGRLGKVLGDYVTLTRGTTYQGDLVGAPGPALLGLGSIEPGGGFRYNNYSTYGGECPDKLILNSGDLYVALKGATKDGSMIGSVARVPPELHAGRLTQDTVKLNFKRDDKELVSLVYWTLRTPEYREYCAARQVGTTSASLQREDFLSFPVPELTASRRSMISLFDAIESRIRLAEKSCETIEALGRALYQSWVLRDPQDLPSGWRTGKLGDIIEIFDSKRVPLSAKEREQRKGPFPYYGAASVMDHVDDFLFDGIHVLMGEDGSVVRPDDKPVLQYVWGKFWVNNHAHVLRGRHPFTTEHIYLLLQHVNIRPYITGAVQPKLNQGNLFSVPVTIPPSGTCRAFADIVEPLYEKYRLNAAISGRLASLQRSLLPALLNGERDVIFPAEVA